jgi:predicted SAM-dependent methyltransferase
MRLDIGCGKQSQKKPGYFGIDINEEYEPDLVHDCNKGLPFKDKSIERVYMNNSLEHFKNPNYILSECFRTLESSGRIEVIVPNVQYFPLWFAGLFVDVLEFWNWYMNLSWKKDRTAHVSLWTRETLKVALQNAGFTMIVVKGSHLGKEVRGIAWKA